MIRSYDDPHLSPRLRYCRSVLRSEYRYFVHSYFHIDVSGAMLFSDGQQQQMKKQLQDSC
jgi:hypothetical protein